MAQTRRVRFGFRFRARRRAIAGRPRSIIRYFVPKRMRQESPAPVVTLHEPVPVAVRAPLRWPVLAASASLEVRIAETDAEIEAAQKLRYRVFYQEMSAIPTPAVRAQERDFDQYDAFCDHMLVVDREKRDETGAPMIVGTYRLLRSEVAARHGGYYTSSEYDLDSVLASYPPGTRFLELGRSCVLRAYRSKPITMQLLWGAIVMYCERYSIDVMFGCGSLPGTDPEALALQLSYLHHFHRAPEGERVRARAELYVEMNRMPKESIVPREALRALPPLIKGYVRTGSYIGDGAVVDREFGTTDVLIYFPVARINKRWRTHFGRPAG